MSKPQTSIECDECGKAGGALVHCQLCKHAWHNTKGCIAETTKTPSNWKCKGCEELESMFGLPAPAAPAAPAVPATPAAPATATATATGGESAGRKRSRKAPERLTTAHAGDKAKLPNSPAPPAKRGRKAAAAATAAITSKGNRSKANGTGNGTGTGNSNGNGTGKGKGKGKGNAKRAAKDSSDEEDGDNDNNDAAGEDAGNDDDEADQEFECEYECGFDGPTLRGVEAHEVHCLRNPAVQQKKRATAAAAQQQQQPEQEDDEDDGGADLKRRKSTRPAAADAKKAIKGGSVSANKSAAATAAAAKATTSGKGTGKGKALPPNKGTPNGKKGRPTKAAAATKAMAEAADAAGSVDTEGDENSDGDSDNSDDDSDSDGSSADDDGSGSDVEGAGDGEEYADQPKYNKKTDKNRPPMKFHIGLKIEAVDSNGIWWDASVIIGPQKRRGEAKRGDQIKVHFTGWSKTSDIWHCVESSKLRQSGVIEKRAAAFAAADSAGEDGAAAAAAINVAVVPVEGRARYGLLNEALSEVLGSALNNGGWPEQYDAFEVLPARDELPEYYRQIKKPMDLQTMRIKVAGFEYDTATAFLVDASRVSKNAMMYNNVGSNIYTVAYTLLKAVVNALAENPPPGLSDETIVDIVEVKRQEEEAAAAAAAAVAAAGNSGDPEETVEDAAKRLQKEAGVAAAAAAALAEAEALTANDFKGADDIDARLIHGYLRELAVSGVIHEGAKLECGDCEVCFMEETGEFFTADEIEYEQFPMREHMDAIREAKGSVMNGWNPVTIDGFSLDILIEERKKVGKPAFAGRFGSPGEDDDDDDDDDDDEDDDDDKALASPLKKSHKKGGGSGMRSKRPRHRFAPPVDMVIPKLLESAAVEGERPDERVGVQVFAMDTFSQWHESCFACGSIGVETDTTDPMVHCKLCAEPYHSFCGSAAAAAVAAAAAAKLTAAANGSSAAASGKDGDKDADKENGDEVEEVKEVKLDPSRAWTCDHCLTCSVCSNGQPRATLLTCDKCSKQTHKHCLKFPPSDVTLANRWVCADCVECEYCQRKTAGDRPGDQWMFDYSACRGCGDLRLRGNFCPVCEAVYRDDDWDVKMIECEQCSRWVHMSCGGLTEQAYDDLQNSYHLEDVKFLCAPCKVSNGTTSTNSKSTAEDLMEQARLLEIDDMYTGLHRAFQMTRRSTSSWFFSSDYNSRDQFANYHDTITEENDLKFDDIDKRLAERHYKTVNDFMEDIELIFSNCREYFTDEKMWSKSADETERILLRNLEKFLPEDIYDRTIGANLQAAARTAASEDAKGSVHHAYTSLSTKYPSSIGMFANTGPGGLMFAAQLEAAKLKDSEREASAAEAAHGSGSAGSSTMDTGEDDPLLEGEDVAAPGACSSGSGGSGGGGGNPTGGSSADGRVKAAAPAVTNHKFKKGENVEGRFQGGVFFYDGKVVKCNPDGTYYLRYDDGDEETAVNSDWVRAVSPADERACELCPNRGDQIPEQGGRLLPVQQNSWVHINCALWSAEVYENEEGALLQVGNAFKRGKVLKCVHEECKKSGATIGCANSHCKSNMHFACAVEAGCQFHASKNVMCPKHHVQGAVLIGNFSQVHRQAFVALEEASAVRGAGGGHVARKEIDDRELETVVMRIGAFTIQNLGEISLDPGYHLKSTLYPIGYRSTRMFWSCKNPLVRTPYVFQTTRGDDAPLFTVETEGLVFTGTSPDAAWSLAFRKWKAVLAKQGRVIAEATEVIPESDYGADGVEMVKYDGFYMFGFSIPAVVNLLERLPSAGRCRGYKFRYFQPAGEKIKWKPRVNPTGCARSEPYNREILKATLDSGDIVPKSSGVAGGGASKSKAQAAGRVASNMSGGTAAMVGLAATMQYRQHKKMLPETVAVKHSKIEGWGLFAKRKIKKDEMIIEYMGEVIRTALVDHREAYYDGRNLGSYMFCIDDNYAVDATLNGGQARFVNHACDPNCFSNVIEAEGKKHIMIYALRDIPIHTELVYDYKFPIESDLALKVTCNCGAKCCRGTMN